MAIVSGTNAGFVTTRPTVDPAGDSEEDNQQGYNNANGYFTSPAGNNRVTEFGWYMATGASGTVTWSIGLYASAVGDASPTGSLLASAGGTVAGSNGVWVYASLGSPYTLAASTKYWLVLAAGASPAIGIDASVSGSIIYNAAAGTTLLNPWSGGGFIANEIFAIYALYSQNANWLLLNRKNELGYPVQRP